MKNFMSQLWKILRYLTLRVLSEGLTYRAASLAYTTILAIVPISIAIFAILGYFPAFLAAFKEIQQFIIANFVAESAALVSQYLNQLVENIHHLSALNIIFLTILDIVMLYNIHRAFRSIWHTKEHWHLSLFFLAYVVVFMLAPLILGGVLILGAFVYQIPIIAQFITEPSVRKPLFILMPRVVTLLTFTIFNWVLPFCRIKFTHALLGGLVTTIIFELAKALFVLYIGQIHTYRELYGTLAIFPLFLIWLYVSWLIILVGALVTNLIAVGIPENWQAKLNK